MYMTYLTTEIYIYTHTDNPVILPTQTWLRYSLFTNKVSQTSALRHQAGGESPAVDDFRQGLLQRPQAIWAHRMRWVQRAQTNVPVQLFSYVWKIMEIGGGLQRWQKNCFTHLQMKGWCGERYLWAHECCVLDSIVISMFSHYSLVECKNTGIECWLGGWSLRAVVNGMYSTQRPGESRMSPEPVLLNIFIHDLEEVQECMLSRFASGKSQDTWGQVQMDQNEMEKWLTRTSWNSAGAQAESCLWDWVTTCTGTGWGLTG